MKKDKVDQAMKNAIPWSFISILLFPHTSLLYCDFVYFIILCIKCVLRYGIFCVLLWLFYTLKEKIAWWFNFHRPGGPRKIVDYTEGGEWVNHKDGDPPID